MLQIVNVGCGPEPVMNPTLLVQNRSNTHQEPAIHAILSAHALLIGHRLSSSKLGFEDTPGRLGVIRMYDAPPAILDRRSEEHTSELQSLMRISYAVFC